MLGKIEGRRRRGRQRMSWLDGQVLPPSLHEELGGRRLGCRHPGEAPRLGWQGMVRVWGKSLPHRAGQAALSRMQAKTQELGRE